MRTEEHNPNIRTVLMPFLVITFGLTWGIALLLILFPDQITAVVGEISMSNPLFILAVYSPGFAGIFMVWKEYGFKGLKSFFRRLTMRKASKWWWTFLILGIPAVVYLGAALKGTISDPFPFSPWYQVFPALGLALFLGPIEEFGWRGLALPLLQRKYAPFWSGLFLGLIWAAWHIPAFLLSGTPQSSWSFVPYFGGVVAISVILTPLFNQSGGSLLIAVLYHFQMMNPVWPDAQPWDNLLFILLAAVIVYQNRQTMFNQEAGVTDIMMDQN